MQMNMKMMIDRNKSLLSLATFLVCSDRGGGGGGGGDGGGAVLVKFKKLPWP